ncbi:hypothetical protein IW152_000594 [Coemansia sp. BCRC 34962]|nr:hypothetical protein IW152_000594 [Coemansia sp. BCRC 34962]
MDYPADYTSPSQQPGLAASIPDINPYTSPPLPSQHPPTAASAELLFSQHAFADGQHSTISSEPDYAHDDGSQILDDANARRRSINSSKRAAQNRAAQRAFRLRRERYVTSLEEKARNYDRLESAYMDLQRENHQLRAHLQKTLSENAAIRAHLATSAPVSPSLSGTLATPFSPGAPVAVPIAGALAQQPLPHQPQLAESSLFHRQTSQQQQRPHHHQSHSHSLSHSHQLSQEQLRHTGRRSACSDNSPYALGYGQTARHSPSHTSTSPTTTNYHSSTSHARPPPQSTGASASSLLHRRPQSPSGAQFQQRPAAIPCQLRREHSLQHLDSNSPPLSQAATGMPHAAVSPIQTLGYIRRFEALHTGATSIAFANPVECMSSPSSAWDNSAGMETSPTASGGLAQYRLPVGSESASSCSSATTAQMLPSVREITMSIGALLPTSPHSDHGPSTHQQFSQESSGSQVDDAADSKRRPW